MACDRTPSACCSITPHATSETLPMLLQQRCGAAGSTSGRLNQHRMVSSRREMHDGHLMHASASGGFCPRRQLAMKRPLALGPRDEARSSPHLVTPCGNNQHGRQPCEGIFGFGVTWCHVHMGRRMLAQARWMRCTAELIVHQLSSLTVGALSAIRPLVPGTLANPHMMNSHLCHVAV